MKDPSPSSTPAPSRWQRFKSWAGGLALLLALVVVAILVAEIEAVQALASEIDASIATHPWLIAAPIGLMVLGGGLMLGAQFLPAPKKTAAPTFVTG